MKSTKLCALLICLIPLISAADDTKTNQSVVFEKSPSTSLPLENSSFGNKTDTQTANDNTENYCNGLLQKIEDLKGKPLRRTAARDRYELECTSSQGLEHSW